MALFLKPSTWTSLESITLRVLVWKDFSLLLEGFLYLIADLPTDLSNAVSHTPEGAAAKGIKRSRSPPVDDLFWSGWAGGVGVSDCLCCPVLRLALLTEAFIAINI